MLTLYLIRHGETDYNVKGIVQGGGVDSDLNENGRNQGRAFFETYKHIPFTKIYCSRLKRTQQTIQDFASLGYEFSQHEAINEFGWGDLEGMSASDETKRVFQEITAAWERGELDKGMPNGENPLGVWARCEPFFEELFATHKEGHILVCTHGRTLRIILSQLLGYGLHNMHLLTHDNTGLNILEIHEGGNVFAKILNDLSHIEESELSITRVDYRK